jgi:hypothetical protein
MKASLEVRTRTPRSPAILACAAFAALACLPWAAGAEVTGPRLAASAALLGAAVVLARSGLGDGRQEARLSKDRCRALVLRSGGGGTLYRADVELADGRTLRLSEHADPAEVLRDVSAAIEERAVPLRSTWGLPEGCRPWFGSSSRKPELEGSLRLTASIWPGQASAGWTVIGGATFIALAVALMLVSRIERDAPIHPLSIVLPALSVGWIYLLGVAMLSARVAVSVARGTLFAEERALGLRLRRRSIPLAGVTDFCAVSPNGSAPVHVLFFTRQGPFAVRCEPEAATSLVAALRPQRADATTAA